LTNNKPPISKTILNTYNPKITLDTNDESSTLLDAPLLTDDNLLEDSSEPLISEDRSIISSLVNIDHTSITNQNINGMLQKYSI
jgi:hypothetical protein